MISASTLEKDPEQHSPIINQPKLINKMTEKMIKLMKENDAPQEQF